MSIYIIIMNLPYSYETYSEFVCATIRTFNSTTIPNSNNGRQWRNSYGLRVGKLAPGAEGAPAG